MDVSSVHQAGHTATPQTAHKAAGAATGDFAAALAAASGKKTGRSAADAEGATTDIKLRKDETLKPMEGRSFGEIDGGRRDGLYVNTSSNARHGQTFTMTVREGREFHIYGTGRDRVVVSLPVKDDDATKTSSATTSSTTAAAAGSTGGTVSATGAS